MAGKNDQGKIERVLEDARERISDLATEVGDAVERFIAERRGHGSEEEAEPGVPDSERDPMEVFSAERY